MYVLLFVCRVGLGNWCLEGLGFWPLFHPVCRPYFLQALWREGFWVAAAYRVVMDTLRVQLGLIRGLTLLSRHHSPSLSIVEFNWSTKQNCIKIHMYSY